MAGLDTEVLKGDEQLLVGRSVSVLVGDIDGDFTFIKGYRSI